MDSCRAAGRISLADQRFQRAYKAVGAFAHAVLRTCAHSDVAIHAGAAAEAVVGGAISEIHLLNVAAGRQVLHAFHHFHYAGAALAHTTAVVEVVQALVRVDAGIKSCLAEVGTFDATDLLAFLLKTDGGHGRTGMFGADKLTWPKSIPEADVEG